MTTWQRCKRKLLQALVLFFNAFVLQHSSAILFFLLYSSVPSTHRQLKQQCACMHVLIWDCISRQRALFDHISYFELLVFCVLSSEGFLAVSLHLTFLHRLLQDFNSPLHCAGLCPGLRITAGQGWKYCWLLLSKLNLKKKQEPMKMLSCALCYCKICSNLKVVFCHNHYKGHVIYTHFDVFDFDFGLL